MKRIVTVRHAKAVPYGYEDDFSRSLTERGRRDAGKISRYLQHQSIIPDLMISSPASRALETAMIYAETLGYAEKEILKERGLYMDFTTGEFLEYVSALPDACSVVYFFGHNPSMEFYTGNLARNFFGDMPTCATTVIDFAVTRWKEIASRSGEVIHHLIPRML